MRKYYIETHTRPPPAICMLWKTKSPSSDSALMGNSCSRSGSTDTPPAEQTKRRHRKRIRVAIADAPNSGLPHHSPHMLLLLVLSSLFPPRIIPLSLSSHTNGGAVVVSPPACTLPKPPYGSSADGTTAGPGAPNTPATFSDPLQITFPLLLPP